MAFSGDTFSKLFAWLTDPQRNEKIFNSRLDDEFGGIATGLSAVAARATVLEAAGGSGLVKLTSGTVTSAATLDIVLTGYTAYRGLIIKLSGFLPVTDGTTLYARFSTDGGATYDASGYNYSTLVFNDSAVSAFLGSGSDTKIEVGAGIGNASTEGINVSIEMLNQTSAAFWSRITWLGSLVTSNATPDNNTAVGSGQKEAAQDTDAIRFLFSSGNIAAGNYAVYGLN